jgi:uncharacterized protein YndB with AHSA1/START domain
MLTMLIGLATAAEAPQLRPGLEPLAFLVGHCWRGEFKTDEQDTHCFESVYGGQHLRDRHEVTGAKGVYRGETLYSFDGQAATFTYWNSQGGVSRGTMRPDGDRLDFGDESYTDPNGRRISFSTHWRRVGDDAYEAVTVSPELPSMNRTVRYQRVDPVSISSLRNQDGSHTLVHETVVAAPAARVWEAISTPQGWTTWAVPVAWSDADLLETSYSPAATRGDRTTIKQRIAAQLPGRMILFRTIKAPRGFPNFETFKAVTHAIELEPVDDERTRVRLTSAGYADSEPGRQLVAFFREGNRVSLAQLRQRFATGPIDWAAKVRTASAAKKGN